MGKYRLPESMWSVDRKKTTAHLKILSFQVKQWTVQHQAVESTVRYEKLSER